MFHQCERSFKFSIRHESWPVFGLRWVNIKASANNIRRRVFHFLKSDFWPLRRNIFFLCWFCNGFPQQSHQDFLRKPCVFLEAAAPMRIKNSLNATPAKQKIYKPLEIGSLYVKVISCESCACAGVSACQFRTAVKQRRKKEILNSIYLLAVLFLLSSHVCSSGLAGLCAKIK